MINIQRYDIPLDADREKCFEELCEDQDGEYVKYSDVEAFLKERDIWDES